MNSECCERERSLAVGSRWVVQPRDSALFALLLPGSAWLRLAPLGSAWPRLAPPSFILLVAFTSFVLVECIVAVPRPVWPRLALLDRPDRLRVICPRRWFCRLAPLCLASLPCSPLVVSSASSLSASRLNPQDGGGSDDPRNVFVRQLQMVPGISLPKARALVSHYPSRRELVAQYERCDLSEKEKRELLVDKMGGSRREKALSRKVYVLYTSTDPEAEL